MENQRVRISKKMLKSALLKLLKEKSIDKITVYELCSTAEINRTTFYKYYGSQYDLLKDIERDFFSDLEKYLLLYTSSKINALQQALEYIAADRDNLCVLLNSINDPGFSERLFSLPSICEILDDYIHCKKFSDNMREYIRVFFCNGGLAIVRKWLNDGCRESTEEISELLFKLSDSPID